MLLTCNFKVTRWDVRAGRVRVSRVNKKTQVGIKTIKLVIC